MDNSANTVLRLPFSINKRASSFDEVDGTYYRDKADCSPTCPQPMIQNRLHQ